MSEKKCSHHKDKKKKIVRRICAAILIFLFLVLLTILIVWAVLQPKKPRFILQDTTIFTFNVSAPNIFSTSIQATVYARNPNRNIGIYYDKMDIYATYHNQQITYYTQIPPVYQGHKDVNIWSPFVFGNNVPIAPYNGPGLTEDQQNGGVWLDFKMNGRVKWKVGSVTTGHYHLHVTCSAYVPFGDHPANGGIVVGNNAVKYQLSRSCDVSV
ncbi:PREDICTED: NDR1/HIN1-like protein 12 [Nicotiana attenuata]|uniref:Ndr1hin1-like protein 12 n=1 Tax=Nicotiana attenuata TaxID=49451 RepID=A0A1J6ISQ2_NICAT|nr:PREDICTED: NDR1/HIN1-like protein 12 [Nicotiana attenuata]OIT00751.1 ndr1hin1-like protein 12 [Nicotiana attenuata]